MGCILFVSKCNVNLIWLMGWGYIQFRPPLFCNIPGRYQITDDEKALIEGEAQMTLFKGKGIRQLFHDNEWFFSILDVIEALGVSDARTVWPNLKRQLIENEDFIQLLSKIQQLKIKAKDGKMRETDMANAETIFRIVQSIPSKKAEPFKRWLAKVGYERIQEFQDPDLLIKRAIINYRVKGYDDKWINNRVETILSRKDLTLMWKERGVKEGIHYAILKD